jgi:outer membrane lipoprotein-sorting protein
MIKRRHTISFCLAALMWVVPAVAQTAPLQLGPVKPAAKAPPKPVEPVAPANAVARANAYLNGVSSLEADFVQLGVDGHRMEGKLYIQKPGRLRFEYAPPATLQVIADGTSVAIQDKKVKPEPDLYFIGQTPLKFLLSDRIDLSRDTKVLEVTSDSQACTILIEDHATFGGTARIKLVFDPTNFNLRQWIITDSQGYETVVSLFNPDYTTKPDPALFKINEERMGNPRSK